MGQDDQLVRRLGGVTHGEEGERGAGDGPALRADRGGGTRKPAHHHRTTWQEPLVALVSLDDLELLEQQRATSALPHGALALVGAWREVNNEAGKSLIEDVYAHRENDTGRMVGLEP